ncbi:MAG TPA: AfsR/SARP family transcriptional regulator [Actinophytocola sp.]|uniref:AfsR/SARP family transcriptional regulator n=1 Tax=Actinophytocola sp. TaxID=1872138 RepID=UPI002DBC48A7|nr:AfsR/SARP family transcriptional regulator [Actinophytocola sp.]HEU5473526.1 AfsR/SARP family transcriptional regulator [Actinophytocola sp.]
MEFNVLGPLTVHQRGADLAPSAPKQRQMVALLLLNPGHVVSMGQFMDELWDGNPTPTAVASVHSYIMRLRRLLCDRPGDGPTPGAPRQRLVTLDRAYRLEVRSGELDLDVFHDRARVGAATLDREEYRLAAAQLRAALDMWRGLALPDVVRGPLLHPAIRDLEATRLEVLGQRIWADLQLGRHHELISELAALVCRHPTNDVFATQLMLALHRNGRRAEALDTFHRHRAALREELGVPPQPRLRELYTDILTSNPRLEPATTPARPDLVEALAS